MQKILTAAGIINHLSQRLRSFQVLAVTDMTLDFTVGSRKYRFFLVTQGLLELVDGKYGTTTASQWVEGVIHGKKRNDAGELV